MNTKYLTTLLLTALVTISAFATPVVAQEQPEDQLAVDVNSDGSAQFVVQYTYDLTDDQSKEAFTDLKNDEQSQNELESSFESRLQSVAQSAQEETGRQMSISDATASFDTSASGDTGIVVLSATYDGFAAVNSNELVITEPFASGYSADLPVTITAPDEYSVTSVSPSATAESETSVTWSADTAMDGLELTMTSASGESSQSTPGMGIGIALVAVLGAVVVVRRRE